MYPKGLKAFQEGGTREIMESPDVKSRKRSLPTFVAFFFTLLGAVASSIVLILSLIFQITIRFPELQSLGMVNEIATFLILDTLTLIGAILMYIGALLIFLQRKWPAGSIFAIFGAIVSVAPFGIILGLIGGIIGFCSNPESARI